MYHDPVLLKESIDGLDVKPDGVYVDTTFGGGGHSREILKRLGAGGRLIAFDQDLDALSNVIDDPRFLLINNNFRHLLRFLKLEGVKKVDGILADLGVSSHQFNTAERGFSYRFDAKLDMRMNQSVGVSAEDVINDYRQEELQKMFSDFGQVRNARTLSKLIIERRRQNRIVRISQFLELLDSCSFGEKVKYYSQVFQALRIEVNGEMDVLKDLFRDGLELLNQGGRFVVISYHSLEDGLTKNFFKKGNFEKEVTKDMFGNIYRPFKLITKKAIIPSVEEIKRNNRARSAKMRIAEKL